MFVPLLHSVFSSWQDEWTHARHQIMNSEAVCADVAVFTSIHQEIADYTD
jgi:hypothetical protein